MIKLQMKFSSNAQNIWTAVLKRELIDGKELLALTSSNAHESLKRLSTELSISSASSEVNGTKWLELSNEFPSG